MIAIGVVVAGVLFMLLASTLSRAGRIKRDLKPFIGKTVRVTNWGAAPDDGAFTIESVSSVGAGLLIWLRRDAETARILLKVAQPTAASITPARIEIADARYVQWNRGKRAARVKTSPAVVLTLAS